MGGGTLRSMFGRICILAFGILLASWVYSAVSKGSFNISTTPYGKIDRETAPLVFWVGVVFVAALALAAFGTALLNR